MRTPSRNRLLGYLVGALFALTGATSLAHAVAPANSIITNTASLTYTGLATPITASVDIAVTLVASAPTLSAPADNTVAEGQPSSATYTVTTTSNGPDTYNLTGVTTPTNLTGNSNAAYTPVSVTLGATAPAILAAAGTSTITVPADGVADATPNVNGIAAGDTVVIEGPAGTFTPYTVQSVTDNATGTSSITLTGTLSVDAPVGTLIAEQQSFTMDLATVGSVAGNPASVSVATTATSVANNAMSSSDTHVTNVLQVTMEKLVRNTTNPNGAGAPVVINGQNYFPTAGGVTAVSGDVLEYAIRVTAPAGAAITGATVTDAVPAFTAYVANSTLLNTKSVAGDGAASPLAGGLVVDDDVPARTAGTAATGNIAAGNTAVVTFQVTVQ